MVSAVSYILAKTVLVVPIMFVFAIFALGIPGYVVQDFPASSFGIGIILWAVLIYSFECAAECFAVLFDDPIIGMLQFMNLWFACFLFAGFLIPLDDLYWPFTVGAIPSEMKHELLGPFTHVFSQVVLLHPPIRLLRSLVHLHHFRGSGLDGLH
jgi:hypothetical protein